ncbi:EAL domain-containing protein [Ectobacillus ponti]|uniref:EAL domain-containing protein n=1 Tax=Ectobacillus ponti TaxID=2961894 RepID=A0AA41X3A4_9BACI|nr:EAL domain-containing protein [Ectobacillus ponti]MCP8968159.1 EAL domain-containing protein [Ectobacillus ponti]
MPSVRGYTVVLPDGFSIEKLMPYVKDEPAPRFQKLDSRTFWAEDGLFFEMMDALQTNSQVQAAPARPMNPLQFEGAVQPVAALSQQREASWIDELIRKRNIATYYQPIVRLNGTAAEVIGYELLARGVREDGSIISPYHMFEAARVRNRLFSLDRLCRLEAIRNAGSMTDCLLFINFIPTAIYVPEHCLASTFQLVKQTKLRPEQIVFEVVETDEVQDIRHLQSILEYYRHHGFKYALDDVGTGYNHASKIQKLRPDIVKLAMEHVQGISLDREKQKAALEIAQMTHSIGGSALAEGVETLEDMQCLQELGYDLFQGYYLGKPQPEPVRRVLS